MKELRGKVALVTGAASGIGHETALALARSGCRLILCDIDEPALAATAADVEAVSSCLLSARVDVSSRDEMASFAADVHARVEAVDILVNNAGVGMSGGVLDMGLDDWDWIVSINLFGAIHGCHFFVPPMAERGRGGHVVNLSSFLGFWAIPRAIGYATTKHAVLGMTHSLRGELRPHGIGVSAVCPGIVNTNVIRSTRFLGTGDPDGTRERLDRIYRRRDFGPDRVARAIVDAIRADRGLVLVTPEAVFFYHLSRWFPRLAHGLGRAFTGLVARFAR